MVIKMLAVIGFWVLMGLLIDTFANVRIDGFDPDNPLMAIALLPIVGLALAITGVVHVVIGAIMMSPILFAIWILRR